MNRVRQKSYIIIIFLTTFIVVIIVPVVEKVDIVGLVSVTLRLLVKDQLKFIFTQIVLR